LDPAVTAPKQPPFLSAGRATRMPPRVGSMLTHMGGVALLVLFCSAAMPASAQPGGGAPQKMAPPKWLDDEGKDLFTDLEADENPYNEAACETREKLLKKMAGKGDKDASEHRARVLIGLGLCELKKASWSLAKRRLESAISEMNMPSEDFMLQNQGVAHIALIKQAAVFMDKHEITQASTALRRCREIVDRNLKKVLKMVHKQMGQQGQAPPLELLLEEIPGYGKTGNYLPMIIKQVPILQQEFPFAEIVDQTLDSLDKRVAAIDTSLKAKRLRLESKTKGSLLYVRALASEAVVPAERSAVAQELASDKFSAAFKKEVASTEKGVTLVKRTKEGTGCKEGKGMDTTCKALMSIPDIASNGFGETRLVVVKAGKQQQLDACQTNANIGILLAAKDGASITVGKGADPLALEAGKPVVIDFCLEAFLDASTSVPVLFAQAWHPEFAGLERTTELRARSKAFSLSEDDVKAATKVVNDHAKKHWEKAAKLWREGSEGHAAVKQAFLEEVEEKKKQDEELAEAKRKEDEAGDEERKKGLEALQKKREAKKKAEEEAEQARLRRKKQLEEERANRDPWLNFPAVLEAEKKLEELKEARRDANAKLEFDLSTQLTKDISAAERDLKKAIKKAKKEHKKGGAPAAASDKGGAKQEKKGENSELKALKKELAKVTEQKKKAAESEDFAEAKRLKAEQKELETKIKKLEL